MTRPLGAGGPDPLEVAAAVRVESARVVSDSNSYASDRTQS